MGYAATPDALEELAKKKEDTAGSSTLISSYRICIGCSLKFVTQVILCTSPDAAARNHFRSGRGDAEGGTEEGTCRTSEVLDIGRLGLVLVPR